ncbi:MAG: hypothetical protein Q8R28_06945, partial [Dehalococcoidia bacterium]|nr:hypothetical protein [Dehalococcoidia bacterium]
MARNPLSRLRRAVLGNPEQAMRVERGLSKAAGTANPSGRSAMLLSSLLTISRMAPSRRGPVLALKNDPSMLLVHNKQTGYYEVWQEALRGVQKGKHVHTKSLWPEQMGGGPDPEWKPLEVDEGKLPKLQAPASSRNPDPYYLTVERGPRGDWRVLAHGRRGKVASWWPAESEEEANRLKAELERSAAGGKTGAAVMNPADSDARFKEIGSGLGAWYVVEVPKAAVEDFKRQWPGSAIRSRKFTFWIDKKSGDLGDIEPPPHDEEGAELSALSSDVNNWLADKYHLDKGFRRNPEAARRNPSGPDSSEQRAKELAADPKRLEARLRDGLKVLTAEYRKHFKGARFDFDKKQLIGSDGYFLQWRLRAYPDRPESYNNQQTSTGNVGLWKLGGQNNPHRRNPAQRVGYSTFRTTPYADVARYGWEITNADTGEVLETSSQEYETSVKARRAVEKALSKHVLVGGV